MKTINTCIYARVSTSGQQYDRQLAELREYADRMGYVVVREFSEKISGAKKVEEREALMELLSYVETHPVDKVLIYECSRLSRRAVDFLSVIETLSARKVSVYIHRTGLRPYSQTARLTRLRSWCWESLHNLTPWSAPSSAAGWRAAITTIATLAARWAERRAGASLTSR